MKIKISFIFIVFLFIIFFSPSIASAADRFWVTGGDGNWNSTGNWSDTSGGASGSSVPTVSDNCIFNASSGSGTTTTNGGNCLNLDFTSFTGTWAGSTAINVAGSLTLGAGMTNTYTGTITFTATSSQTITSNGKAFNSSLTFNGVAGTWTLTDNLTTSVSSTITLTTGTFDTGGFDVSTGLFDMNNSNTRVLNLNDSIFTLNATGTVWHTGAVAGLTLNAGTSTILITDTSTTSKTVHASFHAAHDATVPRLYKVEADPNAGGIIAIGGNYIENLVLPHHGASAGIVLDNGLRPRITNLDLTDFNGTIAFGLVVVIEGDLDLTQPTAISSFECTSGEFFNLGGSLILRTGIPSFTLTCQTLLGSNLIRAGAVPDGARTITTNDVVIGPFSGVGFGINSTISNPYTLVGDLNIQNSSFIFYEGSLDANDYDITLLKFTVGATTTPHVLNMGSGTWTFSGTGEVIPGSSWTNFEVNGEESTLILSDTSTTGKTISFHEDTVGSFNNILIPGTSNGRITLSNVSADTLTIDSTEAESEILIQALTINSFNTIAVNVSPYILDFGGASTTSVGTITGTDLTLASNVDTQPWFISKLNGSTLLLDGVSIRDSFATPDETFFAVNSTDLGNNTDWCFGAVGSCAVSSSGGGGGAVGYVGTDAAVKRAVETALEPYTCLPGHFFNIVTGAVCSTTRILTTPVITAPNPPSTTSATFTRTVRINDTGEDVKELQKYLNTHGYPAAITGPGSLGNDTTKFGLLTHSAVVKFQIANGLTPDGIVGPMTRAFLK